MPPHFVGWICRFHLRRHGLRASAASEYDRYLTSRVSFSAKILPYDCIYIQLLWDLCVNPVRQPGVGRDEENGNNHWI